MTAWWPTAERRPSPRLRLFCLPYAGGRSSIFRNWPVELSPDVEIRALALPGRGERLDEPPFDDPAEVVRAAADAAESLLDRDWAVFGHSMGALLAVELARELRRRGADSPALVAVAAQDAPHLCATGGMVHSLPEVEFKEELRRLAGTPPEVLEDREVMALLLPSLRADFRICETYDYVEDAPLDAQLLVLDALGDSETSPEGIAGWSEHSIREPVHATLSGGHFFIHSAEVPVLQAIERMLPVEGRLP